MYFNIMPCSITYDWLQSLLYLQDKTNPLHSAVMYNNILVVEELIKLGENVDDLDKVRRELLF